MQHQILLNTGYRTSLVLAAATMLAGCSGGIELGAEVTGRVTLDGKLLDSGSVVFAPSDGVSNNAYGAVDSRGEYYLRSNRKNGLVPGRYRVSVAKYERVDLKPGERSMVIPKLLTPDRYADVSTSGLEFEVRPGSSTIVIELTSK